MEDTLTPEQYADIFRKKTSGSDEDRKTMLARQLANLMQMDISGNGKQQKLGLNINLPIYDKGPNSLSANLNENREIAGGKSNAPQNNASVTYRRKF